jgi:hypothetical protein
MMRGIKISQSISSESSRGTEARLPNIFAIDIENDEQPFPMNPAATIRDYS